MLEKPPSDNGITLPCATTRGRSRWTAYSMGQPLLRKPPVIALHQPNREERRFLDLALVTAPIWVVAPILMGKLMKCASGISRAAQPKSKLPWVASYPEPRRA